MAHDQLGLTLHFEDVTRRLALEGFVTLAPDYAFWWNRSRSRTRP
nr:dienelactone hydrolase family protein [Rhizobium sp. 42MFCr.1]